MLLARIASHVAELILRDDYLLVRGEIGRQSQGNIKLLVPSILVEMTIAAEDSRYYRHQGVDLVGVARAIVFWAVRGKLSGASTIEQQLVRTIRKRYELSLSRKLSEMLLAVAINGSFDKLCMLQVYLVLAYFGWRANGLAQALDRLGIDPKEMGKESAAMLSAMLRLPMPENPSPTYYSKLNWRCRLILSRIHSSEG